MKPKHESASGRVLVTGTDRWATDRAAQSLTAAGSTVMRCHDDDLPPGVCYALAPDRRCPLDAGVEVAVTVRPRPLPRPTIAEFGIVCAHRVGIPVIVAGNTVLNPFDAIAAVVTELDDLCDAVTLATEGHRRPHAEVAPSIARRHAASSAAGSPTGLAPAGQRLPTAL